MAQSFYYALVVALGVANVVLAAIAYQQRSRQLAGRRLHEEQHALAEQRNRMAAERCDLLEQQVSLLTSIRDSIEVPQSPRPAAGSHSPVGVIDVGSTTMRLVVVACRDDGARKRIADQRAFLHLGAEVSTTGRYTADTLRDVAGQAAAFQHHAAMLGCRKLAVVVTAPGRRGENPHALVEALTRATGSRAFVVTPEEEAELAFLAAASSVSEPGRRIAVCDVGGGSTDIAFGTPGGGVESTACFDIGALTLAEAHFSTSKHRTDAEIDDARAAARAAVQIGDAPRPDLVLACGGSARALAKLVGPIADGDDLARGLGTAVDPPKRVARRLHPKRRWSLPAGIVLLQRIHEEFGMPITISGSGLREGIIERLLEGDAPVPAPVARAS